MRNLFLFVSLLLILPAVSLAQGFGATLGGQQNSLVIEPAYPAPGDIVEVQLNDYAGGLFGSRITWYYNGEVVADSTNQRTVEVVAGNLGQAGTVEAVLTPANGAPQTLRTSFTPSVLDVIIEPQTRVPDWYHGRALPSLGSQVNATALAFDGSGVAPESLVYTWQVNGQVLDGGPVRGKYKASFETPRGNSVLLSVTASRPNGEIIASKVKAVATTMPELRFYEQHSLFGSQVFPLRSSAPLVGNTMSVLAEPFYLDTRVYNNPDVSVWDINGIETDNGTRNPYEITLQRSAAAGQVELNFHVRSLQEVLQGVEDSVRINF